MVVPHPYKKAECKASLFEGAKLLHLTGSRCHSVTTGLECLKFQDAHLKCKGVFREGNCPVTELGALISPSSRPG